MFIEFTCRRVDGNPLATAWYDGYAQGSMDAPPYNPLCFIAGLGYGMFNPALMFFARIYSAPIPGPHRITLINSPSKYPFKASPPRKELTKREKSSFSSFIKVIPEPSISQVSASQRIKPKLPGPIYQFSDVVRLILFLLGLRLLLSQGRLRLLVLLMELLRWMELDGKGSRGFRWWRWLLWRLLLS